MPILCSHLFYLECIQTRKNVSFSFLNFEIHRSCQKEPFLSVAICSRTFPSTSVRSKEAEIVPLLRLPDAIVARDEDNDDRHDRRGLLGWEEPVGTVPTQARGDREVGAVLLHRHEEELCWRRRRPRRRRDSTRPRLLSSHPKFYRTSPPINFNSIKTSLGS